MEDKKKETKFAKPSSPQFIAVYMQKRRKKRKAIPEQQ